MNDFKRDSPDLFQSPEEALQYLRRIGGREDEDIDLGEAALALGLIFLPGLNIDRYRQHLSKLSEQLGEEFQLQLRLKKKDTLLTPDFQSCLIS